MDHTEARQALRELGIRNPSPALIENWLRANQAEERIGSQTQAVDSKRLTPEAVEKAAEQPVIVHSSESKLEPVLRETGQLVRQPGPRKPGRPRIVASWFEKVAATMADGTSLRTALAINGLSLSRSEIRACYRNKTLQAMYTEARRRFLTEHYGRKPTLRAVMGRYV